MCNVELAGIAISSLPLLSPQVELNHRPVPSVAVSQQPRTALPLSYTAKFTPTTAPPPGRHCRDILAGVIVFSYLYTNRAAEGSRLSSYGPVPAVFGWKNRVIPRCTTTLTSFGPESSIVSLFKTYPASGWIIFVCVKLSKTKSPFILCGGRRT